MSTLWLFGDSFAWDHQKGDDSMIVNQWHRQVARELGLDYENFALEGAGLEHLYYEWYRTRDRISSGDLVIVAVTSLMRVWLIENHPGVSTLSIAEECHVDTFTYEAIKRYFQHLDHDTIRPHLLKNWLYNVSHLVEETGCKVLLLPCFYDCERVLEDQKSSHPQIDIARGCLLNVQILENVPKLRKMLIESDGRANHITRPNHKVLSDKIIAWYREGISVNLQQGFYENLIDGSDLSSPDLFLKNHKFR